MDGSAISEIDGERVSGRRRWIFELVEEIGGGGENLGTRIEGTRRI